MSKIVSIERCRNCQHHQWTTHHDPLRYNVLFEELKRKLSDKGYTVIESRHCRMGAFEVSHRGMLVFSKFKCQGFPHVDSVVSTIEGLSKRADVAVGTEDIQKELNEGMLGHTKKPRSSHHSKRTIQAKYLLGKEEQQQPPQTERTAEQRFASEVLVMSKTVRACRAKSMARSIDHNQDHKKSTHLRLEPKVTVDRAEGVGSYTDRARLKLLNGKLYETENKQPYLRLLGEDIARRSQLLQRYSSIRVNQVQ